MPRTFTNLQTVGTTSWADEALRKQFQLHLHRGIGYLAAPNKLRSIADLVGLSLGRR